MMDANSGHLTGRERIAELRAKGARQRARRAWAVGLALVAADMVILAGFGDLLSQVVPSFLPARPGVLACWAVAVSLYWTLRLALPPARRRPQ